MKHILSFCFAAFVIMIAALQLRPALPVHFQDDPGKTKILAHYGGESDSQLDIAPANFSPGTLPKRILIPGPAVKYITVSNDRSRDEENLALNGLLYRDLEPDSDI